MSNFERELGEDVLAFNTVQNAAQALVEMLGSRQHMIVSILPINSDPKVLTGIMRGGSHPLLLDTDPDGVNIDPAALQEALGELEGGAVVFLNQTLSETVSDGLWAILEKYPTVVINEYSPNEFTHKYHSPGDFNVYYLDPWIGCGAVLQTEYTEQLDCLRTIRSGVLGLDAELSDLLADRVVLDAPRMAVEGRQHKWRSPLHRSSEISRRWMEAPDYPNAEAYYKQSFTGFDTFFDAQMELPGMQAAYDEARESIDGSS